VNAAGNGKPRGRFKGPVRPTAGGVTVAVRLTPGASADRIDGVAAAADGTPELRARVTAVPEGGKANAALIKMLAKRWKLPKSAMTIAGGAKDRRKLVRIAGDPATLAGTIEDRIGWRDG
jgi:uncharacterized protein YggU (UPF0235/DUF167 family)